MAPVVDTRYFRWLFIAFFAEKTPMCLINELARYNKIQHQYRLTDEAGPPHKKLFTVCLKLGDTEEYIASGPSIKKAQHAAAAIALEKTKLKHPPPKSRLVKNSKLQFAQHDELESNLKKIPHRNGIWGLEAIAM